MNCIFICVFNQEKYVDMFYLLLESILLYGNLDSNTEILVYTSTEFMNMIKQSHLFDNNKIKFDICDIYDSIDKACKARLNLFNLPSIIKYNKILYLDTDILIKYDINKVFNVCQDDILYVLEEGFIDDITDFWGKSLFGDEFNNYEDKNAFTSGILLFNNCHKIKELFIKINEDIINRSYNFVCCDQPYIVYNAFKYNLYNNKILKSLVVNNDTNIYSDKVIHHFPGHPGVYQHKIDAMTIFLNDLKCKNVLYNGAKLYNRSYCSKKNTVFPLVAICVSYNYFDTLQFALPVNYMHFDKIYLITQEDDIQTIEFCKKFDSVSVYYYDFKNNGKKFDKYGAINFAQQKMYEEYPDSWYMLIDSDIILPNNFIDILSRENLNPECIYGAIRNNIDKSYELLDKKSIINNPNNINFIHNNILYWHDHPPSILGCFQLYKKKCFHQDNLPDASFGDYAFGHDNFNIFCNLENITYIHLGPNGANWSGKVQSFNDDINIQLCNIYYTYERECNNVYYDKNCNVYNNCNYLNIIDNILINKFTLVSKERLQNIYNKCSIFKYTDYSFVECGVAKGGCLAMIKFASGKNNKIFGFDSFDGMPDITKEDLGDYNKSDPLVDFGKVGDNLSGGIDSVYNTFNELNINMDNVILVKGYFQYTLQIQNNIDSIGNIAILRLDGDWYESTKICLEKLYNNVIDGGIIIIDDYGHFIGAKRATDEFRTNNMILSPLIQTDYTEYYWVKDSHVDNLLSNSLSIDDDIWTCSSQMRYDIYEFFKDKSHFKIAEIGSHKGYSTKILSKLFSKVYAVDNSIEWTNFNKNFNKNATNIEYIILDLYKDSWEILPEDIEVSFIDAIHSYDCCKSDIMNSIKQFKNLKYIIFDDYGIWPEVKQIIDELIDDKLLKFEQFIGMSDVPGPNGIVKNINEGIICSINFNLKNKTYTWEDSSITFLDNFKMLAFGDGEYKFLSDKNITALFGFREHNIVFNSDYTKFVSVRKDDLQIVQGSLIE